MELSQVGLIGLGVMGSNLALNLLDGGFSVSVFNRSHPGKPSAAKAFVEKWGGNVKGFDDLSQFAASLERPRKIILMVKAGEAVDEIISALKPFLEDGDIIIDGGNSDYRDTARRVDALDKEGILFVGTGISGGEEGARHGASIMVGGNPKAWTKVKNILQSAAAKNSDGTVCCKWIGEGGAGHFVKMVHNGIEYADMQLISDAFQHLSDSSQKRAIPVELEIRHAHSCIRLRYDKIIVKLLRNKRIQHCIQFSGYFPVILTGRRPDNLLIQFSTPCPAI